ncbi:MAG: SDR family oxidoreductase [Acidimicrobiales bacterium]|nr:SDR family oxidoreductase [Acidimicrobiales bacterium]
MGLLDGKVAVITGAGSGMGRAASEVFVREGAQVLGADVSGAEEETASMLGDAFVATHCDVTQEAEVEALIRGGAERFGRVDAVLNVAGIADAQEVHDMDMALYDRILDVDLKGVVHGTKHALRLMREQGGGTIINWSSIGGINGSAFTGAYSAAKAGVIAITKTAAIEDGPNGIRVNCICPGFIVTNMSKGAENLPGIPEKACLMRVGQPEEVGEVAAFLASDRASFVTGAVIPVDGGWIAKVA